MSSATIDEGWVKYERGAEELRLAFFDGLKGKPDSFERAGGSRDPVLVVLRLAAAQ